MDNYAGAYAAGKYLIELGHKKIGYLKSEPELITLMRGRKGSRQPLTSAALI